MESEPPAASQHLHPYPSSAPRGRRLAAPCWRLSGKLCLETCERTVLPTREAAPCSTRCPHHMGYNSCGPRGQQPVGQSARTWRPSWLQGHAPTPAHSTGQGCGKCTSALARPGAPAPEFLPHAIGWRPTAGWPGPVLQTCIPKSVHRAPGPELISLTLLRQIRATSLGPLNTYQMLSCGPCSHEQKENCWALLPQMQDSAQICAGIPDSACSPGVGQMHSDITLTALTVTARQPAKTISLHFCAMLSKI